MLNILQLTDTHIFDNQDGELYSVNTRESLVRVINDVKQKALAVDLVLVTGDLTHDGSSQAYLALDALLNAHFDVSVLYLPGNHDDPSIMSQCLGKTTENGLYVHSTDNWVVIMLDSSVSGEVAGNISAPTLENLKQKLQLHSNKHVLLAVHHHPIKIQSKWMDEIGIKNSAALLNVVRAFNNVKLVINGHVHQNYEQEIDNIQFFSTPSTCFQFLSLSDEAGIDTKPPGYRYLKLQANGIFQSQVIFLED